MAKSAPARHADEETAINQIASKRFWPLLADSGLTALTRQ